MKNEIFIKNKNSPKKQKTSNNHVFLKESTNKFQKRAQTWSDLHVGFHCTVVSYNVFALPVLTHLSQLMRPPDDLLKAEEQALRRITPGPTAWISKSDLWWLRALTGHPCSVASLRLTSQAAQTRVRVWDPACADQELDLNTPLAITGVGGQRRMNQIQGFAAKDARLPNNLASSSTFQQRAQHLRRIINAPDLPYTRAVWRDWFEQSMFLTLDDNFDQVQSIIGPVQNRLPRNRHIDTARVRKQWVKIRRQLQAKIYSKRNGL